MRNIIKGLIKSRGWWEDEKLLEEENRLMEIWLGERAVRGWRLYEKWLTTIRQYASIKI